MQAFTIENVRGWYVVSAVGGRIVGIHPTAIRARRQVAAINLRRNAPKCARRSVK